MTKISEAVERLREWTESDGMRYAPGHMATGDAFTLADAYQSELDPTPIDEDSMEWLESLGFEYCAELEAMYIYDHNYIPLGYYHDGWHYGESKVLPIHTRGDVRTWCRALKINLKESA
jgi:hypothetical protein